MQVFRAGEISPQEIPALIAECEAAFRARIEEVAQSVYQDETAFLLISGPSSAGKTTFMRILSETLLGLGRSSIQISLDNYFFDHSHFDHMDERDVDYESIEAIDTVSFFADMEAIIRNEMVELPIYDFTAGSKKDHGFFVDGARCDLVLVEGLHALNNTILETLKSFPVQTVFLDPQPQIYWSTDHQLSGKDLRFFRRLVRDYQFRNSSVLNTFRLWDNVGKGEQRYVYPEAVNARCVIDTTHLYEVGVLKPMAQELLLQVESGHPRFEEAQRLLQILAHFDEIDTALVPAGSLLREFIGGVERL